MAAGANLLAVGLLCAAAAADAAPLAEVTVVSPNRHVQLTVRAQGDRLTHEVRLDGIAVVEPSDLGILVDRADLGKGAALAGVDRYRIDETYAWRGVHSRAVDRCNGARVTVRHAASRQAYTVDLRVFDDAAAFRFLVPGSGRRVPDAACSFRLPLGAAVWYHGARDHYEGVYARRLVRDVPADDWAAPPLTLELPNGGGYVSITEAGLHHYAGMMLQAEAGGGFRERLGHSVPASYPFTLRYGEDEARRLSVPAAVQGPIVTPWRVVLAGKDLDALVNSDAISNLSPPPDARLFPKGVKTPWLRPGRAVWRFLDGGDGSFEGIKAFSRLASELGFEHQIVEGQWRRWSDDQVRELVEYSRQRGVSIWLWINSRDQRDVVARRQLFDRLHALGVAGIKVDFFDHEARDTIELYHAILADAAERRLLVDFHGANKPAGEARTWPNEMTREGVRGLEHRSTPAWAAHNATLPFTRLLAGHADTTPVVFGERRKETTAAHQVATAVVFTSPVIVYGAHPASLLQSPAVDVIRSLPSVWDETSVLPCSRIGELAAFARRSGRRWFLGIVNGPAATSLRLPLVFLERGRYEARLVRDDPRDPAAPRLETADLRRVDTLAIEMPAGGGFVARFTPR